jgi:hypothetical protein
MANQFKKAFLVLVLLFGGCSDNGLCSNEILSAKASPNREIFATLFVRGCGATTADSLQVGLFPNSTLPNVSGNLFVATVDTEPTFAAPDGNWVEVKWLSNRRLLIRYTAEARVFSQETSQRGVSVHYEKVLP